MILEQRNFDNFILRLIKFKNFIALDYFNYSTGLFLKTFEHEQLEQAKELINTITREQVAELLK